MDPRSYDKIIQDSYSITTSKAEKKHLDTVQRKEKLIEEANRLRKVGYSFSGIARKLQKNPRTIKRYLKQEVTPVSKAYGSKRRGSILQPYHKEIDPAFEKGMMSSKIEQLIRKRVMKALLQLFATILLRRRKSGKESR